MEKIIIRNVFQKALNEENDIQKRKALVKRKKEILNKDYEDLQDLYNSLDMIYKNMEFNEEEEKSLVDIYKKIDKNDDIDDNLVVDIVKNKYSKKIDQGVLYHYIYMAIKHQVEDVKRFYVSMMMYGINKLWYI